MNLRRLALASASAVALGLGALGTALVHRSDSETDGALRLAGLTRAARIVRDASGIPHIFAENRRDLALAFGYAEAQDRLWQLDFNRHAFSGTLSEVLGPAAVASDLFVRTIGLPKAARAALLASSPEVAGEVAAFAAGVNAFVDSHPRGLPLEFLVTGHKVEPFGPEDCSGSGVLLAWQLSGNLSDELLASKLARRVDPALLADLFPEAPETALPGEAGSPERIPRRPHPSPAGRAVPFSGIPRDMLARLGEGVPPLPAPFVWGGVPASNNWVLGGERTTTGKPILANDPHLPIGLPSVWYEVHLVAPGIDVIGATLVGLPYVAIGHNRRIAFGFTNVMADNQDLFVEKMNPANPRQVRFEDHWEDVTVEPVTLRVKGGPPVVTEILTTRHGPILNAVRPGLTETVSLRWVGRVRSGGLEGFRRLDEASGWEEARSAVRTFSETSLNLAYADVDGNIGWQASGAVPVRAKGDGRFPVPGWTGEYEWTGMVPFEELPSYYLPAGGTPRTTGSPVEGPTTHVIVTANQRTVRAGYPHALSSAWAAPYRFLRISELLGRASPLSPRDVERLQADQHPLLADRLLGLLDQVAPDEPDVRLALRTLRGWDGQVTARSSGAVLYELVLVHLMRDTYESELGDLYGEYASRFGSFYTGMDALLEDPASWSTEARRGLLKRSLREAVREARQRLGDDPGGWRWGDLHRAVFGHILGRKWPLGLFLNRSVPLGGDGNTVNNGQYSLQRPFRVAWASSYRMVVDLADMAHASATNTTGESGRPFTAHYDDMIDAWSRVSYHTLVTREDEILSHARATLRLEPQVP